jgi:hypothetical protein
MQLAGQMSRGSRVWQFVAHNVLIRRLLCLAIGSEAHRRLGPRAVRANPSVTLTICSVNLRSGALRQVAEVASFVLGSGEVIPQGNRVDERILAGSIVQRLISFCLLSKYRDYTHPMREDVKKKHFSTPLREIPEW